MSLDFSINSVQIAKILCDIPSVSGNEQEVADLIQESLSAFSHLSVERISNNIIAKTSLGRDKRVVIAGHIDTVPIKDNVPAKFIEDDTILWGRGSVDMKSGAAVMVKLAAELAEPLWDITWIWYENEEVAETLNGLKQLADSRPEELAGDFAILCEPSNAEIEGGCNGNIRVRVYAEGTRAHSARAWLGDNAIHKLSDALLALANYRAETVNVDGLDYRESLSAVGIEGGVAGNVIPDAANIHVNYRFAPSKSVDDAYEFLTGFFAPLRVEIVDAANGARPGLDSEFAAVFISAVGAETRPKYGWTDVARFARLGIPAVNYGPGDPNLAHTDNEQVPVEQIIMVEEGLRAWLQA